MAVELKKLLEAHKQGALNLKYEKGDTVASVGDTTITLDDAEKLCRVFGWTEHRVSAFEALDKTEKFVKSIKSNMKDERLLEYTKIEFQNKRDTEYGRTFDRIVFDGPGTKRFTIIHGMKSAGGSYVVYELGKALVLTKCRTLKNVVDFIEKYE